jgi:hypothetical protein
MRGAGHVTRMGEKNMSRIYVGSQMERDNDEGLYVGGKIMLTYVLERYSGVVCTGMIWPG